MVRLPIVAENWLDGNEPSGPQTLAPPDGGGGGAGDGSAPKNPIGPIPGYPEDGKHAWRAANDDDFAAAANKYNSDNVYWPSDPEYVTPRLVKAMAMRESGGTPDAFGTDPLQVNKRGDWRKTAADKARVAGLSYGQTMTPQTSAEAALKWLQYRGTEHDAKGNAVRYHGHYVALKRYNVGKGFKNGVPAADDYATTVMNNAQAGDGEGQQ